MSEHLNGNNDANVNAFLHQIFARRPTREQSKDTGMAVVLALLLVAAARHSHEFVLAAIVVHVINMIVPKVFQPAAVLWFGLSEFLGTVASKVLLTAVFFGVVTPVGLIRRAFGADSLFLRSFKSSQASVMQSRNHTFCAKDLEQPF